MRREIRIAGAGGHGVITAAVILADALGRAGHEVVETQHYGPEARGGSANADVVWSDAPIHYQGVMELDVLVALTQEGADACSPLVKEGGTVIIDSEGVKNQPRGRIFAAPILATARDNFGAETYAGVVALGVIAGITALCDSSHLETAITERLGKAAREKNLAVFTLGVELGAKAAQNPLPPPFAADL